MTIQTIFLLLGLTILTLGAEILVRGGASLARRLGLTPLVIGLTVVSFGTSAPEMVVSIGGTLKGYGDISLGNVIGSNIFNIGVILGIASMISPLHIKLGLIKLDAPFLVAISLVTTILVILFPVIPRLAGVSLVLLLLAYTSLSIRMAQKEVLAEVTQEFEEGMPRTTISPLRDILFILAGLGLLFFGSSIFIKSAVIIARSFGVSEAVIGLTIIAAGTSMPEFATSIIASFRGQSDIAVGNIIGSNIFNILGILGLASAIKPFSAPGINHLDLWVMFVYSLALLPLLWTQQKLQRWEGALLFGGYILYLWLLWPTK